LEYGGCGCGWEEGVGLNSIDVVGASLNVIGDVPEPCIPPLNIP
jgi:hypothetical protein